MSSEQTEDEDLADNVSVILSIYLAVGAPLSIYLGHNVIDKRWRSFDEVLQYSVVYGIFSILALVALVVYDTYLFKAKSYTDAEVTVPACILAATGIYLFLRRAFILFFFHEHLQRRATAIISIYKDEMTGVPGDATRQCEFLFPNVVYRQGPANGHISSVVLDDNYPGEGPRVTWLRRPRMVKDWTQMMVRIGLWIRLAVLPSSLSFDKALRPRSIPFGATDTTAIDTSGVWTLAVVQQQFLVSGEKESVPKKPQRPLDTFIKCVDGKHGTLATWRDTLSVVPESEWSQALSQFRFDWIEGLEAKGVAWEVYLALALHSVEGVEAAESPSNCWRWHAALQRRPEFCHRQGGVAISSGVQSIESRDAKEHEQFTQYVEQRLYATLGEDMFVTTAVLMAGFPQLGDHTLDWLKRVQQLAGAWHRVAKSLATEENPSEDKTLTEGVDLVVALALLLGANKSSFEFPGGSGKGTNETLRERHKHVVLNKLQDDEAEKVLRTSLERCLKTKGPGEIAQSRYSLGKFLHVDRRQYAEAHQEYDAAIQIWTGSKTFKLKLADVFTSKADMYTQQGQYPEADGFYVQAGKIIEPEKDTNRLKFASLLEKWAGLRKKQGKYEEADRLYVQVLDLRGVPMDDKERIDFAATLGNHAGLRTAQGIYEGAGDLYLRASKLWKETLGSAHPQVATGHSCLVELLVSQGKYSEAQTRLNENSPTIFEEAHGLKHPAVATALSAKAELLRAQGKYQMAEPLYRRALDIDENTSGPDQRGLIRDLRKLANLLQDQGRYREADRLHARAIQIGMESLGNGHPDVATWLADWAGLLRVKGNYAVADLRCRESRKIHNLAGMLRLNHPEVAKLLNEEGRLLESKGEYAQAKSLIQDAETIQTESLGLRHPDVAQSLINQAGLSKAQGNLEEADGFYERAIDILKEALGDEHPDVASSLMNRAGLLTEQNNLVGAEGAYRESLSVQEKVLGSEHPAVATSLTGLARLLVKTGTNDNITEAKKYYERALKMQRRELGNDHPAVATTLSNQAELFEKENNFPEAEGMYKASLAIRERKLGEGHPDVATSLNNLARFLGKRGTQDNIAEAKEYYKRALKIQMRGLGDHHPAVATTLSNQAELFENEGKHDEALRLLEKALAIRVQKLREGHPDTVKTRNSISLLQNQEGNND